MITTAQQLPLPLPVPSNLLYLICENLNQLGNLVPFVSPEHVNFLFSAFEHKFQNRAKLAREVVNEDQD